MHQYDTLTAAINGLRERGYTEDFNLASTCLRCKEKELQFKPEDFIIDEYHRYEGASNPSDNSIVYAIRSRDGIKGVLVDAYGVYAENLSQEMIEKLRVLPR